MAAPPPSLLADRCPPVLLHAFLSALPWTGAVLIIAGASVFAEERLDNGTEHYAEDEPGEPDPPGLLAAA